MLGGRCSYTIGKSIIRLEEVSLQVCERRGPVAAPMEVVPLHMTVGFKEYPTRTQRTSKLFTISALMALLQRHAKCYIIELDV